MRFSIERYVTAQKNDYQKALKEIQSGRKRTHWMWYIFPQIIGLGSSSTAQYYAIQDMDEAKEYLRDDYLRDNLIEITQAVMELEVDCMDVVFGRTDAAKLRSCMTLFEAASKAMLEEDVWIEGSEYFGAVIDRYYEGERDYWTLMRIED